MLTAKTGGTRRDARRVPVEAGFWVLVLGDLVVFAGFFLVFGYYRGRDPDLFARSQAALNQDLGFLNTVLLLTSSLLVAAGLHAARTHRRRWARAAVFSGFACGFAFVVVKVFEYNLELAIGNTPATDMFFLLYYLLTGIHLFHVVLGLACLVALTVMAGRDEFTPRRRIAAEGCACFWHLVDLLWVVLFPTLYLVK